uniref:ARAD1B17226p n=1 Tax=Blastobotrys adeninivorans TaxID=409370 RepID=A0A060T684_BLAAD
MPLFGNRKSSSMADTQVLHQRENSKSYKEHHSDIHDPILSAIQDPQPFEQQISGHRTNPSLSPETRYRDVFGNVIAQPDNSNPTRPRNERPLDTIRAFEYACTGDERIRDEMETPRLGWGVRRGFASVPQFDSNPYAASSTPTNPVVSFSGGGNMEQGYVRPQTKAPEPKKKKGLFGRKKK